MVLYKRKQVTFAKPPKLPQDLDTQVFVIKETKEWFLTYEEYLNRLDYYNRRKFVCEITGNSCLTFFEALESEAKEIKGVEKNFPEALREHILRFLQFNRITRLDQLVDKVYLVFKNDYFPGETIFIKGYLTDEDSIEENGETVPVSYALNSVRSKAIVREKVQYNNPVDGLMTRYLVSRFNDGQQAIVTKDKITRDRTSFTKWLIKTFIKLTMSRSHKVGAPWVVKDKFAKKYRIPQEYPEDLKHFQSSTPNGEILYDEPKGLRRIINATVPEEKKVVNTKKAKKPVKAVGKNVKKKEDESRFKPIAPNHGRFKNSPNNVTPTPPPRNQDPRKQFPNHYLPDAVQQELQAAEDLSYSIDRNSNNNSTPQLTLSSFQPTKKNIVDDLQIKFDLQTSRPIPTSLKRPDNSKTWNKFLIDDLKLGLNKSESSENESKKSLPSDEDDSKDDIKLEATLVDEEDQAKLTEIKRLKTKNLTAIQESLESWAFLNIYHSVLKLDTFTYDDFLFAMGWNYDQFNELGRCELLDEIWCAVLGATVSNKLPTGKDKGNDDDDVFGLQISLPPKDSFINPSSGSNKKDTNDDDSNDEDEDDHGSESEKEDKTLKSDDEDEESGSESGSDNENSSKNSKKKSSKKQTSQPPEDADNEEDEEEDEEEEDEEDGDRNEGEDIEDENREHNAYVVMNHRGTAWHERLRRRNFKDGNWQCIVLGLLSLVEYVPHYKPTIDKVYKVLAPANEPPTPATVLKHFYYSLDIDLKIKTLNILTYMLSSGTLVRKYIDESLDSSTVLRRNRLDNIRDYKAALETAQRTHYQIHERIQLGDAPPPKEETNYANIDPRKRPRLNFYAFEMTPEEEAISKKDPAFREVWETRKTALLQLQELKKAKREIEQKLTEIDCQRVKLLGKDRLFNRYWWFENNGLPNLHASSDGDENDDEEDSNNKLKSKNDEEDEDDDKDEVLEETYLMGKLWIQGPTDEDLRVNLRSSYQEAEFFEQEYAKFHKALYGSDSEESEDEKDDEKDDDDDAIVVDEEEPKIKQENGEEVETKVNGDSEKVKKEPEELVPEEEEDDDSYDPTRFIDLNDGKALIKRMRFDELPQEYKETVSKFYNLLYKSDTIERKVIKVTNGPYIKQEEHFGYPEDFREIHNPASIIGRFGLLNKDIKVTSLTPIERKLIEECPDPLFNGKYWRYYDKPEEINELLNWLNPWGKRESQLRKELSAVKDAIVSSMEARRNALWLDKIPQGETKIQRQLQQITARIEALQNEAEKSDEEPEDSEDDPISRKRNLRRKPAPRKRQKVASIEDTIESGQLSELLELETKLNEKLRKKRDERDLSRVLEWVNSSAIDQFDRSLYEGGDKPLKPKAKKGKR